MKAIVISDTHSRERKINAFRSLPDDVDMVIHCGDFSHSQKTFDEFLRWYSNLDIKYKILIAGNHDEIVKEMGRDEMMQICGILDIIYLQDSSITIEGLKFHGSPWSPMFGGWPFMMDDFELDQHWQKIPDDTNILITHGPAYGRCDEVFQDGIHDNHVGSRTLEMKIRELKELKYHFVGHIHDSCGEIHTSNDGKLITHNASIMNFWFRPDNQPHIFQLN